MGSAGSKEKAARASDDSSVDTVDARYYAYIDVPHAKCRRILRAWRGRKRRRTLREVRHSSIMGAQEEIRQIATYLHRYTEFGDVMQNRIVLPKELGKEDIELYQDEMLGSGNFGIVFQGSLKQERRSRGDGNDMRRVAVKQLKFPQGNAHSSEFSKARMDFLQEVAIMAQLDHKNIISLCGIVTGDEQTDSPLIVTSLCDLGDLRSILRKRKEMSKDKLSSPEIGNLLWQISKGMKYLTSKKFIHRDLAARNVLVTENVVCKVADLGLGQSPEANASKFTAIDREPLPVRWCAPEALLCRVFSHASDVWSFGITAYELFTACDIPYENIPLAGVVSKVVNGYVLPKPDSCPDEVWSTAIRPTLELSPDNRPTFKALCRSFMQYKRTYPSLHGHQHRPTVEFNLEDSEVSPDAHTYEYHDSVESMALNDPGKSHTDSSAVKVCSTLTTEQIQLIDDVWAKVMAPGRVGGGGLESLGTLFFNYLFEQHPEALALFPKFKDEPDLAQSKSFRAHTLTVFKGITSVLSLLKNPDVATKTLYDLGFRHAAYNVKVEYLSWALDALLSAVQHELGGTVPQEGLDAFGQLFALIAAQTSAGLTAGIAARKDTTIQQDGKGVGVTQKRTRRSEV